MLFTRAAQAARDDGKEAYFRLHRYRYAAVLEMLPPPPARVLEIGVTPGQFTRLLVESGYYVSGVDLDPQSRAALWHELGVEVRQANIEQEPVPFADAQFDCVVFSEVIEHLVYSPLPVLRECYRVLKPGGALVLSTPNELYFKSRMHTLLRLLLWRSLDTPQEFRHKMRLEGTARYTTHARTYTMPELCWLVEQAGFQTAVRRYSTAWEHVGLHEGRLRSHPVQVLGKRAVATITAALPPTRSMLLLVAVRPEKMRQ